MSSQRPQPPGRWPSRAIRLAVRALPRGPTRDRYRYEFLAELYGMSSTRQMRHAAQLLSRSLLLRAAVNRERQSSTLELIMPVVAPRKRLLCRLNVRHKWVRDSTRTGRSTCSASTAARISTTSSDLPGRISEVTSPASGAECDSRKTTAAQGTDSHANVMIGDRWWRSDIVT